MKILRLMVLIWSQVDSALKLLRTHPDFQSESFQSAVELLKKLPIYGVRI